MSLDVKLIKSGGGSDTLYFAVDKLQHEIARTPFANAIPNKVVIQYDFGIVKHTINFSGVCPNSTEVGNTAATKWEIEDAAINWYTSDFTGGNTGIKCYIDSTHYYYGQIVKVSFEKTSVLDYWQYSLTFIVRAVGT